MSFIAASVRLGGTGVRLLVLAVGATCLRPLERQLTTGPGTAVPVRALAGVAGPGELLAVLGGFRAAVAGGCWLEANLAWERRDPAATRALIELTVAVDGRPLYFWLNGARTLAYDLPVWTTDPAAPAAVRSRARVAAAEGALAFLARGQSGHEDDPAFWIERGNLHLRGTGNLEEAARCYREAALRPGAPYYAARIHGELLRLLGRREEALAWLRGILPTLPAGDAAAARDLVMARIRSLEAAPGTANDPPPGGRRSF
ncbi:MAG TPA: hypothetical protein VHD61_07650 [Lacunisphaera sp.]|nr:hypothetical protein [Lacunisphaera sp.]